MKIEQKRSYYWDNIKGILMFLTVFAHVLFQLQGRTEGINTVVDVIYTFHMPVFVFVSGFFGKSEKSRSFVSIMKLLFMYFIFNSGMGLIYGFYSLLQPMYSYWYLIALAVWRITAHRIEKFPRIQLILIGIAIFAGFFPTIDNTFAAARIISFYPFYMAGYKLSAAKSSELETRSYKKRMIPGAVFAVTSFLLSIVGCVVFFYTDEALQMAGYEDPLDAFGRIVLFTTAFMYVKAFRYLSPDREIPLITSFGRNSLSIFILHRPVTLIISELIKRLPEYYIFAIAAIASIAICGIFGNDFITKYMNKFMSSGADIFTGKNGKKFTFAKLAALGISIGFVISAVASSYAGISEEETGADETDYIEADIETDNKEDVIYPTLQRETAEKFEKAFRITFAGDLILLEDQVKRGYRENGYNFSDVFKYAEPYISSADLAVGVFEGPAAGAEAGYTSSNYGDGKELYLNFPDEFAEAVKEAGFDLVTTANNHVLDKGKEGALRTLEVLDRIGLDHTGSYRDQEEKDRSRIKVLECQGIKICVLSYTYGSNYIENERLIDGKLSYLTSVISGTEGEQFEKLKADVEEDFRLAKTYSPDLILVLPHMGTQFSNEADSEQQVWFEIFKENGADIILGDHPHVVEPAYIEEYNGRSVFTAYCPGNFANIYRENQGDTSMLIDVYIDRETKAVIGGGAVPLYTYAPADGNYCAVPVYDIVNDAELRKQLTTDDIERASDANKIITKVMFGSEFDITAVTERYYFDESGYLRTKTTGLELTDEMRSGILYTAIENSDSICFIGDSLTEGTKNGGCPWYEPILEFTEGKAVSNFSKGGCTVSYLTEHIGDIPESQLYVAAIGTNDVRYRDEKVCAMTAESYVSAIGELKEKLLEKSPGAEIIFIAPWYSTDGDPFCSLSYNEKTELNSEYSEKLKKYCEGEGIGYIDINEELKRRFTESPEREYLLDHIHPNTAKGVLLYSELVLMVCETQ